PGARWRTLAVLYHRGHQGRATQHAQNGDRSTNWSIRHHESHGLCPVQRLLAHLRHVVMKILAVTTSSPRAGLALLQGSRVTHALEHSRLRGHSEWVHPALIEILEKAK